MNHHTKESLIAFERRIADLWEAGQLPYLLHLSGGNEAPLIRIFAEVQPGDWIFSTHRNHYHYLLAGGSEERLEQLIKDGRSMFVFGSQKPGVSGPTSGLECNFICSSILAGTCAIAAGVAHEIKSRPPSPVPRPPHVWCFLGDGAEDEGHFYEAARFVEGHDLPCTFIIEDNNRSVDTDIVTRRGVALACPWAEFNCVHRYHYTPVFPHAGSGCKHHIQFDPAIQPKPFNHG